MTGPGGGRCFRTTSKIFTKPKAQRAKRTLLEFLSFVIAIAIAAYLARPFVGGRPSPAWLERARLRGKPGVPVTAWLGAFLLMLLAWLIGDQRGILALLLWLLWIAGPLVACWITWLWMTKGKVQGAKGKGQPA